MHAWRRTRSPPPPYKVDTSRPSLRTNGTRRAGGFHGPTGSESRARDLCKRIAKCGDGARPPSPLVLSGHAASLTLY